MLIDVIDDFEIFQDIKKDWDCVYQADSQAQFFLSWIWFSGWLEMLTQPWLILAAKPEIPGASYVAFFPLKLVLIQKDEGEFDTELWMAGSSMADYTGFICLPGYEEEVIPAFSAYIQQHLVWSNFNLQNILETDTRMLLLLRSFSGENLRFINRHIEQEEDNIDNHIAPYVSLTDDWEQYLQNQVSANTRQKIRRLLRQVENSDEFYITHVNAENVESHIEILLKFWKLKWSEKKGDQCEVIIAFVRAILLHCFENNCLYLPVLWEGNRPLGAIANLVDVTQKSMLFYITGRDETVKNLPPGLILHAHAIRYAIQNGFKIYDFLRGNEQYKYYFGAKERRIQYFIAQYQDCQENKLDVRTLAAAFELTVEKHRANEFSVAEQGYRQILATQSNHPEALYGLGVLMRQKGEYHTAENLLKSLLEVQPNSIKALFGLGNLYQTQGELSKAITAYNQVLTLQPDAIAAYNNLGYSLQQQGQWEDAIACYEKALKLKPDCIEAEINLANALYAQGKLSKDKHAHYAAMNYDLATKCQELGDIKTAIVYYQQSIAMNPNLAEAQSNLNNLALVLQAQTLHETASTCDQKALSLT
ncbi:GNAT family N-acetyltransferase [Tolypothrix sp. FACHB-123]|uniref:GNAT family N-acetyltransferase n=1 Tax=Tolypothrix sp. FACHB-123 TaxID=2692868 RepID=UPI0016852297|nr:GNAT family N-acetyltransferase [Tolypothrix sp. FACHB-123]MBD2353316.1 GNAT family N-acetyltransferase [Tolypothrix sp. FACHB-123]